MKKMLLGLSLSVAALGLLVSPAMAASPPQAAPALGAADQAFIASLAAPVKAPATPAPQPAAKRPRIGAKSSCTASANCWNGGTVNCSGNSSCSAADGNCSWGEPGHVTCDGATTWCSACPTCPPNWCTGESDCAASCYSCDYVYTCYDYPSCTDNCRCRFCIY
jgi:hypothetical protein